MITAYSRDGTTKVIDAPVLSISSTDGKPAVFVICDGEGKIEVLAEPNPRFRGLCKSLGLEPADIHTNLPDL